MNAGELITNLTQAATVARLTKDLPLVETLQVVRSADSVGPIVDPTAYRDGGMDNVQDQRELLEALLEVQNAVRNIEARAEARKVHAAKPAPYSYPYGGLPGQIGRPR